MLNIAIDIKRQTIDIEHPMYDITVSALASVGYGEEYVLYRFSMLQNGRMF